MTTGTRPIHENDWNNRGYFTVIMDKDEWAINIEANQVATKMAMKLKMNTFATRETTCLVGMTTTVTVTTQGTQMRGTIAIELLTPTKVAMKLKMNTFATGETTCLVGMMTTVNITTRRTEMRE